MKTEKRTRDRSKYSSILAMFQETDRKIEAWVMHLIEQIEYLNLN